MIQLSLRPYNGKLFVSKTKTEYMKDHIKLFKTPDVIHCDQCGRFTGGEGKDGIWTYLLWGKHIEQVAHELSHCILHVFERCGINPIEAGGEPFCYLLSQLLQDYRKLR